MYTVRNAVPSDLPSILEIYAHARKFMAQTGNPNQWGAAYPPREALEEDIDAGRLYAVSDEDGIHGAFVFFIGEDPTYQQILNGGWHSEKVSGVIHKVAADGSGGVFRACLVFCSQRAKYLRIDTHEENLVMQHVLLKNGFQRCGIIITHNGTPRIAFDRI